MDDLISRQAAIGHAISGLTREYEGEKWIRVSEVRESLKTLPSAQTERKKGKWVYLDRWGIFGCSVCGGQMMRNVFKYCPWCGVEMESDAQ